MLPIYICEDEIVFRNFLVSVLEKYITINAYSMNIKLSTDNPFELIEDVEHAKLRGVYLLDIDIKNDVYNGFTLAQKIREIDPRGFIIFITSHEELSFMTFKYRVEAMDYIIKGSEDKVRERVIECIESVQNRLIDDKNSREAYYTIELFHEIHNIPMKDILYFETSSSKHKIILHTLTEDIEYINTLKNVEKDMGEAFLKVHRSYLVNKKAIKAIFLADNLVELIDGSTCPISRLLKKNIKL